MLLYYIQGSSFARMARVLLREYEIPCDEKLIQEFPPSPGYFEINPLGQVPVLDDGTVLYFPTRLVLERILAEVQRSSTSNTKELPRDLFRERCRWQDKQLLTVLLAMGDMLAASKYQQWAGLDVVGPNLLGFNPAQRNIERVYKTLDWLEARAGPNGFWPSGLCTHDVVLACLILWSEVRGPIEWRGRPKLERIVARLQHRPSFTSTAPQQWPAVTAEN